MRKILLWVSFLALFIRQTALSQPTAPHYSLSLDKTNIAIGGTVTATWTSGPSVGWIDFYPAHLSPAYYESNNLVWANPPGGSASFTLSQVGTYAFWYFQEGTFTPLTAAPIIVTVSLVGEADSGYSVSAQPNTVGPGEPFTVTWTAPATANTHEDWIGVYPLSEGPKAFIASAWVNPNNMRKHPTAGTIVFHIDTPGKYGVKYFDNNSFVDRSEAIEVDVVSADAYNLFVDPTVGLPRSVIKVHWEVNPDTTDISGDWIGLYAKGWFPKAGLFASFKVEGVHQGTASFTLPDIMGSYEVQYFKHDAYIPAGAPVEVEVVGSFGNDFDITTSTNMITAATPVSISWTSPQGRDPSLDSIALYKVGDPNWLTQKSFYIYRLGGSSEVVINEPGVYEFRYFDNSNMNDALAVSPPIYVNEPTPDPRTILNYPPCNGGTNIIFFGDDFVFGTGTLTTNSLSLEVSRLIGNIPIINAGRTNDTTTSALQRLSQDVLSRSPKIVVVFLGGTDILQNTPSSIAMANIESIVDRIEQTGAVVVLLDIDGGLYGEDYESSFKIVASRKNVAFFPHTLRGIIDDTTLVSANGKYPNAKGNALIAKRIASTVEMLYNTSCPTTHLPGPPVGTVPGTTPTPLPALTIFAAGNTVIVGWNSIPRQLYSLRLSPSPTSTTTFTCITNVIGDGTVKIVSIPIVGNGGFFFLSNTPCIP